MLRSLIFVLALVLFAPSSSFAIFNIQNIPTGEFLVQCSAVDSQTVYASGLLKQRIYKSTDGGDSWNYKSISISPEALDFVNSSAGFIAGINGSGSIEVQSTSNGGTTYSSKGSNFYTSGMQDIKFYNRDFGILFCESSREVYITNNGGTSWTAKTISLTARGIRAVNFIDRYNILAAGNWTNGPAIYKSSDGGDSWSSVLLASNSSRGYDVQSVNASIAYHLMSTVDAASILKSEYGGELDTWTPTTTYFLGKNIALSQLYFVNENVGWAGGAKVNLDTLKYNAALYRTLDGGVNWEEISLPSRIPKNKHAQIWSIDAVPGTANVWITTAPFSLDSSEEAFILGNEYPTISSVSTTTLEAGTTESIAVSGTNFETAGMSTTFHASASVEVLGGGVSVSSVTVSSTTELSAELVITSNAATGWRTLLVKNPDTSSASTEIYIEGLSPAGSIEITAITPSLYYKDTATNATITGSGFQSGATISSSSTSVTLEALNVLSANSARTKIHVDSSAVAGSTVLLTVRNLDSAEASIPITIQETSSIKVNMLPIYNDNGTWNPEKGSLILYLDGCPSTGSGSLAFFSGFFGAKIPVNFASASANSNKLTISAGQFSTTPPNGIYSVRLYGENNKILGKQKIAVFRK